MVNYQNTTGGQTLGLIIFNDVRIVWHVATCTDCQPDKVV